MRCRLAINPLLSALLSPLSPWSCFLDQALTLVSSLLILHTDTDTHIETHTETGTYVHRHT